MTQPASRHSQANRLWMIVVLCIAWAVFSSALTAESLWLDEVSSIFNAQLPAPQVVQAAAADTHPPLYYLLLHVTIKILFGDQALSGSPGEFVARLPSAAAALLSVAVMLPLGKRSLRGVPVGATHLPGIVGLMAALLLALSTYERWYAQEARMYAQLTLGGILSTYLLLRALDQRAWRAWLVYAAVAVAGLYTHYYFLMVLLFQNVFVVGWLVVQARRERSASGAMRWLVTQGIILAAFVPWLPTLLTQVGRGEGLWIALAVGRPGLSDLVYTAKLYTGIPSVGPALLSGAGYLLAGGLGLWGMWQVRRREWRRAVVLASLYFLIPVGTAFLVSQWRPIFAQRYVLLALPGWCLLVALGLGALPSLTLRRLALAALAVLMVANVTVQALTPENPPWRDVAAWVKTQARPGDFAVFIPSFHWRPFVYYAGRAVDYQDELWLPNDDLDWRAQFAEAAAGHRRIWLIWWRAHWGDPDGRVQAMLAQQGQLVTERQFPGIDLVQLYDLQGGALRP